MTSDTRQDPLAELSAQGVAVWLDDLSRELLASGELQLLITGRHVVGVTTNPTIFASALAKGDRYDGQLRDLAGPSRVSSSPTNCPWIRRRRATTSSTSGSRATRR